MHTLAAAGRRPALGGGRPSAAPPARALPRRAPFCSSSPRPSASLLALAAPPPAPGAAARLPLHRRRHRAPLSVAAAAASEAGGDAAAAADKGAGAPAAAAAAAAENMQSSPFTVDEDFDLLSNEVKRLTETLSTDLRGCSLYLVGMMGSGKTTVGRMLANTLRYAFFDTDAVIEAAHGGKSVADVFRENGEEYFRRCETQVLQELAPYKSLVVATGGGAVANPKNWSYMHAGIVAWLKGEPELLARRVVADGAAKRPLLASPPPSPSSSSSSSSSFSSSSAAEDAANNAAGTSGGEGEEGAAAYAAALAKLEALLEQRAKFYATADVVIPLDGRTQEDALRGAPAAVVMHRLMAAVQARIAATREEREAQRNFTIEYSDAAQAERQQQLQQQQKEQQR